MNSHVKLSEVAQINPRLPKGVDEAQAVSFLPMAAISETGEVLFQEERKLSETRKGYTYFERGDILLAKITPCFENGKAAHVEDLAYPIGFGSTEFHVLRPDSTRLDAKYLFFLVWNKRFRYLGQQVMKGAAGQKRVPSEFLENYRFYLPSLDDQKRIAYLLSKVERLIAQRKQHLQQLDELLKSVFLKMFGDPARNERGWETRPCNNVVTDIESGTSYGGEEKGYLESDEYGVLKVSAVTEGYFKPTEFKAVKKSAIKKGLRFVRKGDLLFSRANTNELVAACCAVKEDRDDLFLPDKLWALTLSKSVNIQFFNFLLKNESYRNLIRKQATGGHDSMLNISMKKFYSLSVPVPDEKTQLQFAAIVERVENIKTHYQQSLTDLENLYGALSQKAFKGELDLSRIPIVIERVLTDSISLTYEIAGHKTPKPLPKVYEYPLSDPASRKRLISRRFEAFLREVGVGEVVSIDAFWQVLYRESVDYTQEADLPFTVRDYDLVKTLLFDALNRGQLEQTLNEVQIAGKSELGNQVIIRKLAQR